MLSFVTLCGVALVIGFAQRNVAALEVSSPPAFASQQPLPKPPPPDVRETKVLPLDSQHCTASDTLLFDSRSAEVLARCERSAPATRLLLTVVPRTADPSDDLQGLWLRICGQVLNARRPSGWRVEIKRERDRPDGVANVTWKRLDAAASVKMPASGRIRDFEVTLLGQWRQGPNVKVGFARTGFHGIVSPHDCPS